MLKMLSQKKFYLLVLFLRVTYYEIVFRPIGLYRPRENWFPQVLKYLFPFAQYILKERREKCFKSKTHASSKQTSLAVLGLLFYNDLFC